MPHTIEHIIETHPVFGTISDITRKPTNNVELEAINAELTRRHEYLAEYRVKLDQIARDLSDPDIGTFPDATAYISHLAGLINAFSTRIAETSARIAELAARKVELEAELDAKLAEIELKARFVFSFEPFADPICPGQRLTLLESGAYRDENARIWKPIDGGENYECENYIWPASRFGPVKTAKPAPKHLTRFDRAFIAYRDSRMKLEEAETTGAAPGVIITLRHATEQARSNMIKERDRADTEEIQKWERADADRATPAGNERRKDARRNVRDKANADLSRLTPEQKKDRKKAQKSVSDWARGQKGRLSEEEIAAEVARRKDQIDITYKQIVLAAQSGDMSAAISE